MIQPNKVLPPVATWGFFQLLLVGIGSSGLPLWAHHPLPVESLALPILVCGQVLILSMLFGVLTRSGWELAINLLLMLPFDELAGVLSNSSQRMIAESWGCVGLWMVGLYFWRSFPWATILATIFTTGGAVVDYLRWEASLERGLEKTFGPLSLLPSLCSFNRTVMWFEAAVPAVIALITLPLARKLIHTNNFPLRST